ncbi:MAG: hypothetical protein JWP37_758 [Mucilaginibacter sp.]|nr:hypothetical protein [Mucilaginibacter sp.]
MATDDNAEYLTDSVNFRKYLGVYDEGNEHINVICKGDNIMVIKTSSEFINEMWTRPQIRERKVYSLKDLMKHHIFE